MPLDVFRCRQSGRGSNTGWWTWVRGCCSPETKAAGKKTYGAFDSLREEEPLVDGVDRVVGVDVALPLQKDGPGVQAVVGPEHRESSFLVSVDQRPTAVRDSALKPPRPPPAAWFLDSKVLTDQLMADAPLWRGSRDGW